MNIPVSLNKLSKFIELYDVLAEWPVTEGLKFVFLKNSRLKYKNIENRLILMIFNVWKFLFDKCLIHHDSPTYYTLFLIFIRRVKICILKKAIQLLKKINL